MHQSVQDGFLDTADVQEALYITRIMEAIHEELVYHDTPHIAMWVVTEEDRSAFETMQVFIGEPKVDEMLLDHDAILLGRAHRLNQVH